MEQHETCMDIDGELRRIRDELGFLQKQTLIGTKAQCIRVASVWVMAALHEVEINETMEDTKSTFMDIY